VEHSIISSTEETWQVKPNVKTTLIAFFNIDGLVHHEYVPRGQTVNKEFYRTVLQHLHDAVRRHRLRSGAPAIGSAPAHRAVTTSEFLAKHNIQSTATPSLLP